jgi:Tol biopolymer transport system component
MDKGGESAMKMRFCVTFLTGLLIIGFLSSVFTQPDNNGKIAFVSSRDKTVQIYTMNVDGSNQERVSNNDCVCFFPKWSPCGDKIAFTLDCGILDVYVMNSDGSNSRSLTRSLFHSTIPPDCEWSAWSPDGKKIAFVVGAYIYVIDGDGSTIQRSYTFASYPWSPAWSPDGKKIAFALGGPGLGSIYVMDADGSNVREIAPCGDNPCWSLDGTKIAFDSDEDGSKDIYVMDVDRSDVRRLTDNPSDEWYPTWSPDGDKIAFVSDRDGNEEIYVMNADGMNQVNITKNPADDSDPDWCCQSCQPAESTQLEEGPLSLFSLEGLLPWGLIILVASLMVILIIVVRQRAILKRNET